MMSTAYLLAHKKERTGGLCDDTNSRKLVHNASEYRQLMSFTLYCGIQPWQIKTCNFYLRWQQGFVVICNLLKFLLPWPVVLNWCLWYIRYFFRCINAVMNRWKSTWRKAQKCIWFPIMPSVFGREGLKPMRKISLSIRFTRITYHRFQ